MPGGVGGAASRGVPLSRSRANRGQPRGSNRPEGDVRRWLRARTVSWRAALKECCGSGWFRTYRADVGRSRRRLSRRRIGVDDCEPSRRQAPLLPHWRHRREHPAHDRCCLFHRAMSDARGRLWHLSIIQMFVIEDQPCGVLTRGVQTSFSEMKSSIEPGKAPGGGNRFLRGGECGH